MPEEEEEWEGGDKECYSLLYFDANYSSPAFQTTEGYFSRHVGSYTALGYNVLGSCSWTAVAMKEEVDENKKSDGGGDGEGDAKEAAGVEEEETIEEQNNTPTKSSAYCGR